MEFINPSGLNNPADYGYTQAVIVPPGSKLVYIAGQLCLTVTECHAGGKLST